MLVGVILFATVWIAYWPVKDCQFLNFDDPDYVTANDWVQRGLTRESVGWAFRASHAGNWHPLTWLSHMLDVELYDLRPAGHHVTNLLLHGANVCLLWLLLQRLTGRTGCAAAVAALFALHPLRVESVAWISERKDVLSAFFGLLCLLAYAEYANRAARRVPASRGAASSLGAFRSGWYWAAVGFLALGLTSKAMLVTWPFVLLLLDYWPLKRFQPASSAAPRRVWWGLLLEKSPFFALSIVSCLLTLTTQSRAITAELSLGMRLKNALTSYALYLKQTLWPTDLAVYYPYPETISTASVLSAAIVILTLSVLALKALRTQPWVAVGWFWFLGTLVPVIGFVPVGTQARADRYTYLPLIGLFLLVVWAVAEISQDWRRRRWVVGALSFAVLTGCLVMTRLQLAFWRDSETLFRRALTVTSNNAVAHLNFGFALFAKGRGEEAETHFAEALRIHPGFPMALSNMGYALAARGKLDEAIKLYRAALRGDPTMGRTHYLLGNALDTLGHRAEAIVAHRAALEREPNLGPALNDLAWILATDPEPGRRNGSEAVVLAEKACRLTAFQDAQFIGTLAAAYAEAGRFEEAVATGEKAEQVALAAGQRSLAQRNRELVKNYRARVPWREPALPAAGARN